MPPIIPLQVIASILPYETLSVRELLACILPPYVPHTRFMRVEKYLSTQVPNSDNTNEIVALHPPPLDFIKALLNSLATRPEIQSILCPHSPASGAQRYPLWTVTYWNDLSSVKETQSTWQSTLACLDDRMLQTDIQEQENEHQLLWRSLETALGLSSTGSITTGNGVAVATQCLAGFFTTEWLSDEHESMMLDLLREDVKKEESTDVVIETVWFIGLLMRAHADQENYGKNGYLWLVERGEDTSHHGARLVTIANKNGNHWVALIIDFGNRAIWYGDSVGNPIPQQWAAAVDWWTSHHTNHNFHHFHMPIAFQDLHIDWFHCGVFAWNAISCFLFPSKYALLSPHQAASERLRVFLRLVKLEVSEKCWS